MVVQKLVEMVAYAAPRGVSLSLYPHAGYWLDRVETAVRLANRVNHPAVGVTFNLCHWLKVEGSAREVAPVLRLALPRLQFVTVNGADTGDTQAMGWDRLIQPLGEGTYDVAGVMQTLWTLGYVGPVGFQGFGIAGDPRGVLAQSIKAWRAVVALGTKR